MKTIETKNITKFRIENQFETQFQNSWDEVWIVNHLKDIQEGDFWTTFIFEDLDTSQEGWLETLESGLE
tara:strand:+ start:494 stop:700 length:207 start_codon:yes stop_codon:yes gene_type:complete